jgi:hypothetical protein
MDARPVQQVAHHFAGYLGVMLFGNQPNESVILKEDFHRKVVFQ